MFWLKFFAQTLIGELVSGGLGIEQSGMPQVVVEIISGTILVLLEVILFIAITLVLLLITWIVVFPILKLILRAFGKRKSGVSRIIGALFGVAGGAVVAFSIMVPFTGIVNQLDEVAKIELGGAPIVAVGDVKPLDEYVESPLGKFYLDTGKGVFASMTSFVDSKGATRSLEGAIQATATLTGILNEFNNISSVDLNEGLNADSTATIVESLNKLEQLKEGMGEEAKEIINEVFSEMLGSYAEEVDQDLKDIDFYEMDFASVGESIEIMQEYKDNGGATPLADDEANTIVKTFASNLEVLDVVGRGTVLVEADEVTKAKITAEVNSCTELSQADKNDIMKMFGIVVSAE